MALPLWIAASIAGALLVTRFWYSSRFERIALGSGVAASCIAGVFLAVQPPEYPWYWLANVVVLGAAIPAAVWAVAMGISSGTRPFPPAVIALGISGGAAAIAIPNLLAMRRAVAADARPAGFAEPGFVPLDDLARWHLFRSSGHRGWESRDGELVRVGAGGDLASNDAYGDFELRFEWKISRGGNSGVMYRVSERAEKPWQSGPEFQILDDARHPDGKNPLTSAGAIYGLLAPGRTSLAPVGAWNDAAILVDGDHVTHRLNGRTVVDTTFAALRAGITASKFAAFPEFATGKEGLLVLQDHGDEVAFRHLRIRVRR